MYLFIYVFIHLFLYTRERYFAIVEEVKAEYAGNNDPNIAAIIAEEARNRYMRQFRPNFDPNEPYYIDIIIGQGVIPEIEEAR